MEPLFLVLALLAVERATRLQRWTLGTAVPVALALGAITYVYAGGRLLAPLLALALVATAAKRRWRWVVTRWVGIRGHPGSRWSLYSRIHPGALSRRYDATTFVTDDMPRWEIAGRGAVNYLQDLQLWHYVVSGDVKPYAHTPDERAPRRVRVALGRRAGPDRMRHRSDPFWRYAVAALLVSPIPAAATADRFHALRLAPLAVMLVVVAIPALDALRDALARGRGRGSSLPAWSC